MMKMKRSIPAVLALMLVACLPSATVFAGTQAEYQALQQWCVGRDKWTEEGRKAGYSHPKEYFHFHHYCNALRAMKRLNSTIDRSQQRALVGTVIGETKYVITHVPENHFLMPEVYAIRGRAQAMIMQAPEAETNLMKALQLDSKHLDVYLSLSNLYLATNRKEKAVEAATAGLGIDPQNKPLRRLAGKLDIKLEEAVPSVQSQASLPPSAPGQTAATQETKPDATATSPAPVVPGPDKRIADAPPLMKSEMPADAGTTPPRIGSTNNPWCRFCPDSPAPDRQPSNPGVAPKVAQ